MVFLDVTLCSLATTCKTRTLILTAVRSSNPLNWIVLKLTSLPFFGDLYKVKRRMPYVEVISVHLSVIQYQHSNHWIPILNPSDA
jgi:hypothetical protein